MQKIHILCLVVINSVLFNFLCVWTQIKDFIENAMVILF